MLSDEQRKIIEDSLWVVNTALKKQHLQYDDDMRQSAILYMCKCIERFDPSKNIKWTTYAYKNVYLFIKRTHKKQQERLFYEVDDYDTNIKEMVYTEKYNEYTRDEQTYSVAMIKSICTEEEKKIVDLRVEGYSRAEIGKILKCDKNHMSKCIALIKVKSREAFLEK